MTVIQATIEGQQTCGGTVFPCLVQRPAECAGLEGVLTWARDNKEELLRLATIHGAVFFRDFLLDSVDAFDGLIQALSVENFPYRESLSNAVRVNRTERVFTANEAPPEVNIFFHHEMAQTPVYPARILFYCEIAPNEGGATPICRSDVLYEKLKESCPEFIEACESKGLKYTNVMPDIDDPESGMGRSWRSTLRAESRDDAEAMLGGLNYTWEWLNDGCLKATTPILPAVMEVSPGRKTFFNQLIAAYCGWKDSRNDPSDAIRHGDSSILDAEAVNRAIALADELAFDVGWQAGDAALLDNRVAMHARRPFQGTRKVVASLADKREHAFSS